MGADNRQYDARGTKSSWRHWKRKLKVSVARLRRRLGKRLLEDAPKRVTGGWTE